MYIHVQCILTEHNPSTKAIWQMELAISLHIPTEAKLCLYPLKTPPETGSISEQLLPLLNSQGRTIDVMLPDGNCLFRSLSKVLFATLQAI